MPKPADKPKRPLFPSVQRRCKYCDLMFQTKPTWNGSNMKFCCSQHRTAFSREGKKPIHMILKKQEKRMRQVAREEIEAIAQSLVQQEIAHIIVRMQLDPNFLRLRTEPNRAVADEFPRSV